MRAGTLTGLLLSAVFLLTCLVPQAVAWPDNANEEAGPADSLQPAEVAEEHQRFFDALPPEVVADFGIDASGTTYGGSLSADVEGTQQFDPLPIERVVPVITGASDLDTLPVVDFQVFDQFGFGVEGFVQDVNVEFEFTVSKLVPAQNGNTPYWQTYIVVGDEGIPGISAGAYLDGTLQDLGDGNYRFTFAEPLEDIGGVMFEPDLTHRVGMEVRDPAPFGEEVRGADTSFDILPATGETEGIPNKRMIVQENCSSCHGSETFAFHGGPRQDVEQCLSCHQPNAKDAFSGNSLDLGIMVHKIHNAENLTQLPYQFCGFGCENFGAPPDDFSHVVYPQSVKNCTTCHNPDNPETPEASLIDTAATAEKCASCHDDLAFDENGLTNANRNHIGLAQPNETCEACHAPDGLLQGNLAYHVIDSQVAAQRFSYNILDVTNTGEGQSPIVTFSITDPTNGNQPYLIAADPAFTSDETRLEMAFAWPNRDYSNVGNDAGTTASGRPVGQPVSVTLSDGSGNLPSYIVHNGDGTYTLDTMMLDTPVVVPSTTPPLGSGTVMIEGHPGGDFDFDGIYESSVPATTGTASFAINDANPQDRPVVVSLENCQTCHNVNDGLAFHGNNRADNIDGCASCHTPNSTDLFRRPVDPDGIVNQANTAAVDGREDRTVSFGYMVHAIHAASVREEGYVAYGFGGSVHDYSDASYSRSPAECQACHDGDTYTLPLGGDVLALTTESNATVIETSPFFPFFGANAFAPGDGSANDPSDDNNVSPETAACASCHNSDTAIDHMSARSDSAIAFGNGWIANPMPFEDPDTQMFIDSAAPENCAFCHSEGSFVPVSETHLVD
jgi:OmcA/MtrC family decaheme c-type cytochrome